MKTSSKFILSLLFVTTAVQAEYNRYSYFNYYQTSLSRDYSVSMTSNGTFTNLETNEEISGVAGEKYSFKEEADYVSSGAFIGLQDGFYGKFFEVGVVANSYVDEIILSVGKTFPESTLSRRWLNPFIKGSFGLGYTDADSLKPTSQSFGVGVGFISILSNRLRFRMEYFYTQREWAVFSHSYGDEVWEDKESSLSLGIGYLF